MKTTAPTEPKWRRRLRRTLITITTIAIVIAGTRFTWWYTKIRPTNILEQIMNEAGEDWYLDLDGYSCHSYYDRAHLRYTQAGCSLRDKQTGRLMTSAGIYSRDSDLPFYDAPVSIHFVQFMDLPQPDGSLNEYFILIDYDRRDPKLTEHIEVYCYQPGGKCTGTEGKQDDVAWQHSILDPAGITPEVLNQQIDELLYNEMLPKLLKYPPGQTFPKNDLNNIPVEKQGILA
jgi:hypothetical protein